jgi:hypothetical protein
MTDRTYSPSGWGGVPVTPGQRVLPGADLGREVPLPPQPPLEDESTLCGCAHCRQPGHVEDGRGNVWQKCSPTCDMQIVRPGKVQCSCKDEVESPDLPIPAEALEAAAAELYGSYGGGHRYQDAEPGVQAYWRDQASLILAAALPHLRSLQVETQVRAGRLLGLEEAAAKADEFAEGVANPEKPYNEAFIHACGVVARHIRDLRIGKGDPK